MDVIIGLGSAGCKIADQFAVYPQYDVYKIDVGLTGSNCFALPQKSSPEEYERSVPDMNIFFKDIEGDVLFIVGGGKISGASLRIMQQLQNCNLSVLYIKPDLKSSTKTSVLQHRTVCGVLQEYARSGIFKNIYLIDNTILEKLIGDVPILEYNNKLNSTIVNVFHYINFFNHTDPVLQNAEQPKESQRISTIGVCDLSSNIDTSFFDLQNVGYKCYYYGVSEKVLKTDATLFKTIKDKAAEERSSYRVHLINHEKPCCFFVAHTSFVQTVDTD